MERETMLCHGTHNCNQSKKKCKCYTDRPWCLCVFIRLSMNTELNKSIYTFIASLDSLTDNKNIFPVNNKILFIYIMLCVFLAVVLHTALYFQLLHKACFHVPTHFSYLL